MKFVSLVKDMWSGNFTLYNEEAESEEALWIKLEDELDIRDKVMIVTLDQLKKAIKEFEEK